MDGLALDGDVRSTLVKRPWLVATTIALIPSIITLLGMGYQLGLGLFGKLLISPRELLGDGMNPWFVILRPLVGTTVLLWIFAWMAASVSQSALFRSWTMWRKRALVATLSLLAASTLWMGVIVGDTAWHDALGALISVGMPTALSNTIWVYVALSLGTAVVINYFLRPGRR